MPVKPMCPICRSEILPDEIIISAVCGHGAHLSRQCLLRWLARVMCCPVCRLGIKERKELWQIHLDFGYSSSPEEDRIQALTTENIELMAELEVRRAAENKLVEKIKSLKKKLKKLKKLKKVKKLKRLQKEREKKKNIRHRMTCITWKEKDSNSERRTSSKYEERRENESRKKSSGKYEEPREATTGRIYRKRGH